MSGCFIHSRVSFAVGLLTANHPASASVTPEGHAHLFTEMRREPPINGVVQEIKLRAASRQQLALNTVIKQRSRCHYCPPLHTQQTSISIKFL